ncbi:hypothetical protein [Evansella cellulosilytica]|nr:hypothetical protein [Evansella cellulosilytica]
MNSDEVIDIDEVAAGVETIDDNSVHEDENTHGINSNEESNEKNVDAADREKS